jgi:TolB-like protein/Tfp pilus assembly protein PilF
MSFLAELKRRRVVRVAIVYGAVAFTVLQAADLVVPRLQLPDWTVTLMVVLALLGFPIALVLAWAFELTPDGVKRTEPVAAVPPPTERPAWIGARTVIAAVVVVAVGLLAATLLRSFGGRTADLADRSIAVLPFADLSATRDKQFFSDGLTDELISALSQVRSLRVAARTSSFAFRNREMQIEDIARELNVATVLEGSVLRDRDRMRIKVQLVDAARGYSLWSRSYDRRLNDAGDMIDDIFEVQSDIAAHVIERLGIELSEAERSRISARPADSHEAYTLYLKGRYFWHERTEAGRQRALEYYEQAVDLDPGYALAWAGIADVWISRGWYAQLAPHAAFPKAKHAALRALEFDSTLAAAHASLAHIHLEYDHDWAAADREYRRAIQLEPTNATAHHWYGGFLSAMGRHEEALAQADTALTLDPLAPIIQTWQGLRYYFARRHDDAIAAYGKVVQFNDGFAPAHWHLSWAYLEAGRASEGLAAAQRSVALDSGTLIYVAAVGYAYARAGREAEARATLARLVEAAPTQYVSAYEVAVIHAALGDTEEAFRWLDRAYAEQAAFIGYMRVDPRLDPLRADPRFTGLLQRARLEV